MSPSPASGHWRSSYSLSSFSVWTWSQSSPSFTSRSSMPSASLFSPGLLVLWENKVEEYECRNMYERKCRSVYQGEQKGCASCNFLFTSVEWVLAQHLTSCKHSLFNFLLQKAAYFPSIVVLLRDIHPSPQQVMLCFEQTIVESLAESAPADELVFCQYSK